MARKADPIADLLRVASASTPRATWGNSVLECLHVMEAKLIAKGFPPLSPWWWATLTRLYAERKRRIVVRVGRRGGKSSSWSRVAVAEALAGQHAIPPGDTGVVGIVSIDRPEASNRLKTIKAILDAMGVAYDPRGETIELRDRPVKFAVATASIAGVVGSTWIFGLCDEVARWEDRDTGANPADDVLASLRPTMATMPNAKLVLSSSPLGTTDAHARAFDIGDTESQLVAYAPSWIANPTLSEASTRADEPNERVWRREYLAIPQGPIASVFDPDAIDRAMRVRPVEKQEVPILAIDASRGNDDFAWAVVGWSWENGAKLHVREIGAIEDARDTGKAVRWLAAKAQSVRATIVAADHYEAGAMGALFSEAGCSFVEFPWTAPSKRDAVDRLERMLRADEVLLVEHDKLKRQLLEYSEKITRSGSLSYSGRGRHDDFAAVVITAVMADMARRITPCDPPKMTPAKFDTRAYYDQMQEDIEQKAEDAAERRRRERLEAEGLF